MNISIFTNLIVLFLLTVFASCSTGQYQKQTTLDNLEQENLYQRYVQISKERY